MTKKMKLNKNNKIILIIIVLILLITIVPTFGRFVYDEIKDFYFNSKKFYFNSDKLTSKMSRYQIDNWNGVDSYEIIINMNSIKNNKISADTDILYDVNFQCSSNVICDSTQNNGIIYSSTNTDYFIITITPNHTLNNGDSAWLEVTASSTEPYKKTISGRFVLNIGVYGLSYEITDSKNAVYLETKITNTLDYYNVLTAFQNYSVGDKIDIVTYLSLTETEKSNCASAIITLEFDPNVLVLDTTSPIYLRAIETGTQKINNHDYINKLSFKIDAISSNYIKFYKVDSTKDYTYPLVNNSSIVKVTYS